MHDDIRVQPTFLGKSPGIILNKSFVSRFLTVGQFSGQAVTTHPPHPPHFTSALKFI